MNDIRRKDLRVSPPGTHYVGQTRPVTDEDLAKLGYVKVTDRCPLCRGSGDYIEELPVNPPERVVEPCANCDGSGRVLREGVVPVFRQGGLSEAFYRDDTDDPDGYLIPASMLEADDE